MKGQVNADPAGLLRLVSNTVCKCHKWYKRLPYVLIGVFNGNSVSKLLMQFMSGYTICQITDKTFNLNPHYNCAIFTGVSDSEFVVANKWFLSGKAQRKIKKLW